MGPMGMCTLTEAADYGRNDCLKTPRKKLGELTEQWTDRPLGGRVPHQYDPYCITIWL